MNVSNVLSNLHTTGMSFSGNEWLQIAKTRNALIEVSEAYSSSLKQESEKLDEKDPNSVVILQGKANELLQEGYEVEIYVFETEKLDEFDQVSFEHAADFFEVMFEAWEK